MNAKCARWAFDKRHTENCREVNWKTTGIMHEISYDKSERAGKNTDMNDTLFLRFGGFFVG